MRAISENLPWEITESTLRELIDIPYGAKLQVLEPDRAFGGFTGEKRLLQIGADECIFIKKTTIEFADREAEVYRALSSVGAPVIRFYNAIHLSTEEALIAVEYLPYAVSWPITTDLHLAWAEAVALLASCPVPVEPRLPTLTYRGEYEEIIQGIDAVLSRPDLVPPSEISDVFPTETAELAHSRLEGFLEYVDTLPKGLTHGECFPMHMGRRKPDGEVLLFDVTSAGVRPRFYDVQGFVVDHGEPYEIADTDIVLRRFLEVYDQSLSWNQFRDEVRTIEGLLALKQIAPHMRMLESGRGEAWQNDDEARIGHLKWIRLSFRKIREVLLSQIR
jgi:hypothetical protein